MKRISLLAIICTLTSLTLAQNFDNLMSKKQIDCRDISYNSSIYFIKYMQENKLDSAKALLQYWENKCGAREPIYRAKILLALIQNEYNDTLLQKGILNNIFNYQSRMDMIKHSNYYPYDMYTTYFGFIPPGQEFDKYTQHIAKSLMQRYKPDQTEYLLTEFYGENCDTLLYKLQTNSYHQSALTEEYGNTLKHYLDLPEYHMSWITGMWIPTGKLNKLGIHPELGFQMGVKYKKMNYDIIMAIKFLNSPNAYYARRTNSDNSLELTNHFLGGHIGIDVGRDLYTNNGHEFQLVGGIAYDGFDALEEDKDRNLNGESISTYNFNIGLGYRYYITNTFYLGLRAKYNVVDYSLNNVIDFTGNPVTIQFIIGGLENALKHDNLKALGYKVTK